MIDEDGDCHLAISSELGAEIDQRLVETGPSTVLGPVLQFAPLDHFADPDLLAAMVDEQVAAFDELYSRYGRLAYSIACRVTGDRLLAEDVTQDAFLAVWRNAAHYDRCRASVKTWLAAIVHHRAVDAIRRRRFTVELPDGEDLAAAPLMVPDVWVEIAGRLDRDEIRAGLAALSPVQRQAIELAYFGGLSQQEVADRIGAPLGTIKSRIRLGLLKLRHNFESLSAAAEVEGSRAY